MVVLQHGAVGVMRGVDGVAGFGHQVHVLPARRVAHFSHSVVSVGPSRTRALVPLTSAMVPRRIRFCSKRRRSDRLAFMQCMLPKSACGCTRGRIDKRDSNLGSRRLIQYFSEDVISENSNNLFISHPVAYGCSAVAPGCMGFRKRCAYYTDRPQRRALCLILMVNVIPGTRPRHTRGACNGGLYGKPEGCVMCDRPAGGCGDSSGTPTTTASY